MIKIKQNMARSSGKNMVFVVNPFGIFDHPQAAEL